MSYICYLNTPKNMKRSRLLSTEFSINDVLVSPRVSKKL